MDLDEQNRQTLFLVQAMLGMVSPNIRGASIELEPQITLHFVLETDSEIDREEISDAEFQFIAYQDGPIEVKTKITVSSAPISNELLPGRKVYLRREPSE